MEFDLERILTQDIVPTLTDMTNNQYAFWDAFKYENENGTPIKNILELGVMRLMPGAFSNDLPGQTTKMFMALLHEYKADKHISLDLDKECKKTIEHCKKWMLERGLKVTKHEFVVCNSVEFNAKHYFPKGVDLILLDTNHDDLYPEKTLGFKGTGGAGMTYKEICYYAPHLSPNGRLFLHDTQMFYVPKGYGVNTQGAIERFLDENPGFGFHEHNKNDIGLGEIFRKDSNAARQYA